jgi:hypothetical protein
MDQGTQFGAALGDLVVLDHPAPYPSVECRGVLGIGEPPPPPLVLPRAIEAHGMRVS